MTYLAQTTLNGRHQIKTGDTLGEDLDVVRGLYLTFIKNTFEEMERANPGMVVQLPLKPGGTLLEGVRIMATDSQGRHQGDVYTVELHSV
jgi:hypothetical protein